MRICLFVSRGILFLNLVLHKFFLLTVSFHTADVVLIISALPFPFLVGSYVVTIIICGETFDATSRSRLEMPLVFSYFTSFIWSTAKLSLYKTA